MAPTKTWKRFESFTSGYIQKIYNITRGCKDYVFRGQDNSTWLLVPSATRRIMKSKYDIDLSDMNKFAQNVGNISFNDYSSYHKHIIDGYKARNYHYSSGHNLREFEILAELQHYEASTMFIDFSKNFLVALFFAVRNPQFDTSDGSIYIINKMDLLNLYSIGFRKNVSVDEILNNIQSFFKENNEICEKNKTIKKDDYFSPDKNIKSDYKLYYWEPAILNQRIPAQHSLFVFGAPVIGKEFFTRINVSAKDKRQLRSELSGLYDISDFTIFNDVYGYAKVNNSTTPIDNYSRVSQS
jgi:hypothetical protein